MPTLGPQVLHCQGRLVLLVAAMCTTVACKGKGNKAETNQNPESPILHISEDAQSSDGQAAKSELLPAPPLAPVPLGLPAHVEVAHNPTTAEKVAMGKALFSELRMSKGKMSCASCHQEKFGWSTRVPIVKLANGKLNKRHIPSLWNLAYAESFLWDGRGNLLESVILGHWAGQLDVKPEDRIAVLKKDPTYLQHVERSFGHELDANRVAEALAAYVRSIQNGNSAWDRYEAGDSKAVSREAILGAIVFNDRAGCGDCHAPPLYTDYSFYSMNLGDDDVGRAAMTGSEKDRGAFRTPTLRGVANSAPYFHNGSAENLEQVIRVKEGIFSVRLSEAEREQLIEFLRSLSATPPLLD